MKTKKRWVRVNLEEMSEDLKRELILRRKKQKVWPYTCGSNIVWKNI